MPNLYNPGEKIGPGFVVSDVFRRMPDGSTIERVETSFGMIQEIHDHEDDCSYQPMRGTHRRGGPLVPYTVIHNSTQLGLPNNAEWVYVGGSRYDYWRTFCDYWTPDYDLTIIEHDVQVNPDVFRQFEECPEPWCVFPYDNHTPEEAEAWRNLLGCTRFRKELITILPDAVSTIQERWRDWHYVCDGLGYNLRKAGYTHHWHGPPVSHHRMLDLGGVHKIMTAKSFSNGANEGYSGH